jgi:penicillin amidase
LPEPSAAEIRNATATTIYSLWRARLIANTVDATLARVGLGTQLPGSEETLRAVIKLLRDFPTAQGRGASGLDFFQVSNAPGLTTANDRRDFIVLQSLREALDRLASADFAPAFNRSTNIDDYRWGRLHRIVFDHPLGGPFNIPGANPYPFRDLASNLPGLARQGTTNALDVAAFNVRAQTLNGFMFGSGPARRFIGDMTTPIKAQQIIPGGQSGVLGSPLYVSQLGRWLTNRYKNFPIGAPANLALEATRVNFTP